MDISQRFNHLANVDQLWRRHALNSAIEDSIMREARECCGFTVVDTITDTNPGCSPSSTQPSTFSWQTLLRTATLIERENRRLIQGNLSQMTQKIHQVREALERQTRMLEETHQKLELLSSRLTQMEQQSRVRELERTRMRRREEARLEDEKWMQEWDALCASHRSKEASSSTLSCDRKQEKEERKNEFRVSMVGCEEDLSFDEDDDDELFTINSSFKNCTINHVNGSSSCGSRNQVSRPETLEEIQLPIEVASNGKELIESRAKPGL
ncbi:hypothetical protein BG015_004417 [Linnemannia schmuckeri]|uniref:Uncharacterized protein n=1 Tax=Linnemannia schmuckeri TaxID=64567 RepID=A0A9P5S1K3_9FUNG|nr:hypothetical protein BG015_004417 [Linnemannia schmuckeri]